MEKLARYRQLVCELVERYAGYKFSYGQIETHAIIDTKRDHYLVMDVGWNGQSRVHHIVFHIDIINGKIWFQYNSTDRGIVDELIAAGIPKEDIVLAFHPADIRPHTGFAVG